MRNRNEPITEFMRNIGEGRTPTKKDYDNYDIPESIRPTIDKIVPEIHAIRNSGERRKAIEVAESHAQRLWNSLPPSQRPAPEQFDPRALAEQVGR